MALMQCDVKGLEIVCAAYLSQDAVLIKELEDGEDLHSNNQQAFGLPSRLIAKVFIFRLLFGGSAYSYANDPEFAEVGFSEKQWQTVIDNFYKKYTGIKAWHDKIIKEVIETRQMVVSCTGRIYEFEPKNGKWPETQIKNYQIQGLGNDIVALARVSLYNRWKKLKEQDKKWERCLLVNTVHDSLVVDYDHNLIESGELVSLLKGVFKDLPANFKKIFGVDFNLSVNIELEQGMNWGDMHAIP